MQGPRNLIVAAVAGAATALAFAPLNLWPLGLVGLALFAHLVVTADSACVVENNIPASSKFFEAPTP